MDPQMKINKDKVDGRMKGKKQLKYCLATASECPCEKQGSRTGGTN